MTAERNDLFWAYIKAASPLTDANTLSMLSFCEWIPIRRRVAANYNTPPNVLEVLSVDPEDDVRLAVACNPSAPRNVIDRLLARSQATEKLEIAKSPDAPRYALERLLNDPAGEIRSAASLTLRLFHAPGTTMEAQALLNPIFPAGQMHPPDLPMRSG
jgi:hypothetical protein